MNKQQELNLQLIALASHNDLNGKKIDKDLRKNLNLWVSAYGFFGGHVGIFHLIPLRDMECFWHIDSIALTCKNAHKDELIAIIKKWKPSDIYVYEDKEDGFYSDTFFHRSEAEVLINVWWD